MFSSVKVWILIVMASPNGTPVRHMHLLHVDREDFSANTPHIHQPLGVFVSNLPALQCPSAPMRPARRPVTRVGHPWPAIEVG